MSARISPSREPKRRNSVARPMGTASAISSMDADGFLFRTGIIARNKSRVFHLVMISSSSGGPDAVPLE